MLQPGTIVDDHYRIVCLLGSGAHASVYRAIDQHLDRTVALKFMHADIQEINEEAQKRFLREARLISLLRHPNILQCYEFGVWQSSLYACVDYFDGESLAQLLHSGKIPWRRALRICIEVAKAMDHAHSQGVIHRDLTPRNILVSCGEDGIDRVRVVDFGLGKSIESADASQKLTQTGDLIGSIYSMSPEQCLGNPADIRSDVYALGCVLIQCLTGEPPFLAFDTVAVMQMHLQKTPPIVRSAIEENDCPADIQNVVAKAVAKQSGNRYPSMGEFQLDLESLLSGGKIKAVAIRPHVSLSTHSRALFVIVGLFIVGILLFPGRVVSFFLGFADAQTACAIGANTAFYSSAFFKTDRNGVVNQCCGRATQSHLINEDTVKLFAMRAMALQQEGAKDEASAAALTALQQWLVLRSRTDPQSIAGAESTSEMVSKAVPADCRDANIAKACFFVAVKCQNPKMRQTYAEAAIRIFKSARNNKACPELIGDLFEESGAFNTDSAMCRLTGNRALRILKAIRPSERTVDAYCKTGNLLEPGSADWLSVVNDGIEFAKGRPSAGMWSEKMLQTMLGRNYVNVGNFERAESCFRKAVAIGEENSVELPGQSEVQVLLGNVLRQKHKWQEANQFYLAALKSGSLSRKESEDIATYIAFDSKCLSDSNHSRTILNNYKVPLKDHQD